MKKIEVNINGVSHLFTPDELFSEFADEKTKRSWEIIKKINRADEIGEILEEYGPDLPPDVAINLYGELVEIEEILIAEEKRRSRKLEIV